MNPENEERYPVYKSRIHRNDMTSEEEMRRDTFLRRDRVLGDKINPEGTTQSHLKVYAAAIRKQ